MMTLSDSAPRGFEKRRGAVQSPTVPPLEELGVSLVEREEKKRMCVGRYEDGLRCSLNAIDRKMRERESREINR